MNEREKNLVAWATGRQTKQELTEAKKIILDGFPKKFWVVTEPSGISELVDILFETTIDGLMFQMRGGLTLDEI